jgi:hypothetical protein
MTGADRALVAREPRLPGLAVLLDDDAFAELLATRLPHAGIRSAHATYVRYKPGTSCLVSYRVRTGAGERIVHARAERDDAAGRLRQLATLAGAPSSLGPGALVVPEGALAVLPALGGLAGAPAAPLHRDLHDGQVLIAADGGIGVLDFDTLAAGDPALDLANLLVHFELRSAQGACTPSRAAARRGADAGLRRRSLPGRPHGRVRGRDPSPTGMRVRLPPALAAHPDAAPRRACYPGVGRVRARMRASSSVNENGLTR